jgi:hypothetical protein
MNIWQAVDPIANQGFTVYSDVTDNPFILHSYKKWDKLGMINRITTPNSQLSTRMQSV